MSHLDTVVAISSAPGVGAIGVVRLSGGNALPIIYSVFSKNILKHRVASFGEIIHLETQVVIDEVICLYFKAPNSYTGEDVIEIFSHGSPYILKSILEILIQQGARLATPGEFTKRAFLNGKMDLTKAESVIDILESKNHMSHAVALGHLKGKLYDVLMLVRANLVNALMRIEASIDFPGDVGDVDREQELAEIEMAFDQVEKILKIQDFGEVVKSGIRVVIVGRTNVGKSSLLNQLVGTERAIVTNVHGTTRDFIDSEIELGGINFKFIDTAGIRDTQDIVEKLGVERVSELIEQARVVLFVLDSSESFTHEDTNILDKIKDKDYVVIVCNKFDMQRKLDLAKINMKASWHCVDVSAKTGAGLDEFKAYLVKEFSEKLEGVDLSLLCNVRQVQCLKEIFKALEHLKEMFDSGLDDEVLTIDLKDAIVKLGEITGEEVSEEVLDNIFSRFCIGK